MAALVGVDLVKPERGARHHGPPRRVVGQSLRTAQQVHAGVVQLHRVQRIFADLADQRPEVGRGAVVQALSTPAVVRGEHHQRVVPLAHGLQPVAKTTEVLVDVVDHGGEHLLVTGEDLLLSDRQVVPCPHGVVLLGVAERQHHVVVEDAQRLLAFEAEASDLIPPGFIPAPVLLQISRPGLQRSVDGTV